MTVENIVAMASEQQIFIALESVKGTLEEPDSDDTVLISGNMAFKQQPDYINDAQFRDTRSQKQRIRGRFPAGEWSFPTYIKPAGSGVEPEVTDLLKACLGDKHTHAQAAVAANGAKVDVITHASNSTTKAYFADASMFKVGMKIKIVQTTPDATSYRTVATVDTDTDFITWTGALGEAVDDTTDITQDDNTTTTALVPDASLFQVGDAIRLNGETTYVSAIETTLFERITFSPALTVACAATDVIKAGVHYTLLDDPLPFSIWYSVGHTVFMLVGASVDGLKMDAKGNEVGVFEFSGKFMQQLQTGTDELAVGLGGDADDLTAEVLDGTKYSAGSVIKIEDEILKVTAVSGDELTVTRGYMSTSRVAHDAGTAVTPWLPTGVESGTPVHGRLGYFRQDGANVSVLGCGIELKNGIKYYEEEKTGTDYAEDYAAVEIRDVKATTELYFRTNDVNLFNKAQNQTQAIIEVPCGDEDGYICVARMPKCEFSTPALANDTEMKATIEMQALATSGNDELAIHFI